MSIEVNLPTEADTLRLGEDIAAALAPGDLVTLQGDLGVGKTTMARAILRALADDPMLEVPSPTFTLVQDYESGRLPAAHLDLYRLSDPEEVHELGLDDMLVHGVALVEWPEHGALTGPSIRIAFRESGDGRIASIDANDTALARIERTLLTRDFLDKTGNGTARRRPITGDASTRGYEMVDPVPSAETLLLMDSPAMPDGPPVRDGLPYSRVAHLAEDVRPFVAIGRALRERGFRAPVMHGFDLGRGFMLTEHLGGGSLLDADGEPIPERYCAAAETLAALHDTAWPNELPVADGEAPHRVPPFDRRAMMIEVELTLDWAFPRMIGRPANETERADYLSAWNAALDAIANAERSLVLRDVQAPNIIWCGNERGHDRIGLIDFQDALIGPAAYDIASLAQDARVTIGQGLEREIKAAYLAARAVRDPLFESAYAVMAAQRACKVFGLWVRLDERDGKPQYLAHAPRTRAYLERNLVHPALSGVREWFERHGLLDNVPERLAA